MAEHVTWRGGIKLTKRGYRSRKQAAASLARSCRRRGWDPSRMEIYKCSTCHFYHWGRRLDREPSVGTLQGGKVKTFFSDPDREYGFIEIDGDDDVFVHINEVENRRTLRPGDLVVFYVLSASRGPKACQVHVVGTEADHAPA